MSDGYYQSGYPPPPPNDNYPGQGYGGYPPPPPADGGYGGYPPPPPADGGYGGYGQPDPYQQPPPPPPQSSYPSEHYGGGMARAQDDDDDRFAEQENNDQFFLKVKPGAQNPHYKLSDCHGRKRALLIGINYFGTEAELGGINDVHNIKDFLITLWGFKEEDMVILTDDQENPKLIPTRANIIAAMQWLVHDAQENDSFFFHYSGHGGYVKDESGDENDGYDETIYPLDHDQYEGKSGQIIDDDMHDLMVRPLPEGCRLTAIFDSCHSGTALDLPYTYSTKGTIKEQNMFKEAGSGLLEAGLAYAMGNREGALSSLMSLGKQIINSRDTEEENREQNSSAADVIMFSGCKDDQTSADAQEAGKATGAMSYAFTTTLRQNPNQTYQELLNSVRDILRDRYEQRPQLSSSHPIDVNSNFVC
ncbi:caspase domain-containing protein [Phascolomyces articulosus]|uniref:Caspase domain-containing protein n=1 Tax=Phascolomyces articulosus TaxID=60185 RepID=A0AAD5JQS8_9FUNG|nr:caspase domain-containing protein [Phascolomyces articulosus]